MIEVCLRGKPVDLPYEIRVYEVTEELFDELRDDENKCELLDGVMIVESSPPPQHDDVSGVIRGLMRAFVRHRRLGKMLGPQTLIHFAASRRLSPDGFFLAQPRVPSPLPKLRWETIPDLVLEVMSPVSRIFDKFEKRDAYQKAGVREIWLVDPETQEVFIENLQKRKYRVTSFLREGRATSTVIPGFWIDVAWLCQDELPDDLDCLQLILSETE